MKGEDEVVKGNGYKDMGEREEMRGKSQNRERQRQRGQWKVKRLKELRERVCMKKKM